MNTHGTDDTHGAGGGAWTGFDLDGTLAVYNGWMGFDHIGEPIAPMVERIRRLHDKGMTVKILTARVAPDPEKREEQLPNPYLEKHWIVMDTQVQTWATKPAWTAREVIQEWCYRHLGFVPEITHEKDKFMVALYDDRVRQVVPNTGVLVEDNLKDASEIISNLRERCRRLESHGHRGLAGPALTALCFVTMLLPGAFFMLMDALFNGSASMKYIRRGVPGPVMFWVLTAVLAAVPGVFVAMTCIADEESPE